MNLGLLVFHSTTSQVARREASWLPDLKSRGLPMPKRFGLTLPLLLARDYAFVYLQISASLSTHAKDLAD